MIVIKYIVVIINKYLMDEASKQINLGSFSLCKLWHLGQGMLDSSLIKL